MEVNQPEQMEAKGVKEEDWEDSGFQHSLGHCTDGQLHGSRDLIGLRSVFQQQGDDVRVALLRRLVQRGVAQLQTQRGGCSDTDTLTSACLEMSRATMSERPSCEARWRGVMPWRDSTLGVAPFCSRQLATSIWFCLAAMCREKELGHVHFPILRGHVEGTSNKIRMVWMWPSRAEMCKGVWPAVVAESGLALCSRSILTSSLWPMRAAQSRLRGSYLSPSVRLRRVLQQELSHFTVSCSGGHVEGGRSLGVTQRLTSVTASREAECLSSRSMDRMWFFLQAIWRVNLFSDLGERLYLAENISVRIVLQEHGGGARVIVPCGDVQRWEADLALRAVVDEQCHYVFVALLEGYRQGGEAVLKEYSRAGRGER
ncbi:hypothetical protein EYF80_003361 [Liparis tanakae]|uniref:Uncharacterized protein n=1 Tax=Liparis tanakae TaxID=230148 RepID=A0A4Z2J7V8_9TELE|nr:hypothetical protein EYF80_003361 [Liparis tanakae]